MKISIIAVLLQIIVLSGSLTSASASVESDSGSSQLASKGGPCRNGNRCGLGTCERFGELETCRCPYFYSGAYCEQFDFDQLRYELMQNSKYRSTLVEGENNKAPSISCSGGTKDVAFGVVLGSFITLFLMLIMHVFYRKLYPISARAEMNMGYNHHHYQQPVVRNSAGGANNSHQNLAAPLLSNYQQQNLWFYF